MKNQKNLAILLGAVALLILGGIFFNIKGDFLKGEINVKPIVEVSIDESSPGPKILSPSYGGLYNKVAVFRFQAGDTADVKLTGITVNKKGALPNSVISGLMLASYDSVYSPYKYYKTYEESIVTIDPTSPDGVNGLIKFSFPDDPIIIPAGTYRFIAVHLAADSMKQGGGTVSFGLSSNSNLEFADQDTKIIGLEGDGIVSPFGAIHTVVPHAVVKVSIDKSSPASTYFLPGGPYKTATVFKFKASDVADVVLTGITVNKMGTLPNSAISQLSLEPDNESTQGYGASLVTTDPAAPEGVNGLIEFSFPDNPIVIPAGTFRLIFVDLLISPSKQGGTISLGLSSDYFLKFADPNTEAIGLEGKGIISPFGAMHTVVQPSPENIDLSYKDEAVTVKNKDKSLYFTTFFKHKNAGKKKFVLQLLMDGKLIKNFTIDANTKFLSIDFPKKNLALSPLGCDDVNPANCTKGNSYHRFEAVLDPKNLIHETNECNSVYFTFTLDTAKNNSAVGNGGGGCDYVTQL